MVVQTKNAACRKIDKQRGKKFRRVYSLRDSHNHTKSKGMAIFRVIVAIS